MAEGRIYKCSNCDKSIEAWSDGNPYFIEPHGKKQYAYHPDHENLARCIGNDSPYLCLGCGKEFMIDSEDPVSTCPKCDSSEICDTFELDSTTCPYCKKGRFAIDPAEQRIS